MALIHSILFGLMWVTSIVLVVTFVFGMLVEIGWFQNQNAFLTFFVSLIIQILVVSAWVLSKPY